MERLVVKARPSVGPLPPSLDSYDLIGVTTQASLFFFSLFSPSITPRSILNLGKDFSDDLVPFQPLTYVEASPVMVKKMTQGRGCFTCQ